MIVKSRALIISILTSVFLLVACNPDIQPPGLTPIPTLAPGATVTLASALQPSTEVTCIPVAVGQASAAIGVTLYLEQCATCHGVQGQGVDAPPLRDSTFVQTASQEQVFSVVANGRAGTGMPGWLQANGGSLTAQEITSIVDYLNTLQGVPSLPTSTPMPTEIPLPANAPTPEPARPSEPGGPGPAAAIVGDVARGQPDFGLYCANCHGAAGLVGIPNPGSEDGTVPALNPIDPAIVNVDPRTFAVNVDLFIEHGSIPEGPAPMIFMPSFGDSKMLTDQQIANVIAYVLHLNGVSETQ